MDLKPKYRLIGACVALSLVLVGNIFAAGFALSGVGSKAIGMGGAFRGLADDYSAAYWNPAGLATQDSFELSFTGIGILPNYSIAPQLPIPGYAQVQRDATNDLVAAPNIALFTDVGDLSWLRFGVAAYVPAGLSTSMDLYDIPASYGNMNPFPEFEWESSLSVLDIHPALAASLLNGRLNLGIGASVQRADATLRQPSFQSLQSMLAGLPPAGLPAALVAALNGAAQSVQGQMPVDTLMEGNGWGYGVNAGLLLKPLSTLSLGISGRTESHFTLEGDAQLALYTPGNPQLAQLLQPIPQLAQLGAVFSGMVVPAEGGGSTELVLPADIGIGIAFSPMESLTVTADAAWTGWSAFEVLRIQFEDVELLGSPVTERVIPENWEDVVRFSAGFELRPSEVLAIRGGYYLDPSPIPEETQGPLIPDIGDKHSINAGIGLKLGALGIDVNYEYIFWPDRTVGLLDANGDGNPDSLAGEYMMNLQSIMSTVTFSF